MNLLLLMLEIIDKLIQMIKLIRELICFYKSLKNNSNKK